MNSVRFGVIGCGSICELRHFPAIQTLPEATLHAVCKRHDVAEVAEKWGAPRQYTDYRDLVRDPEVDAVIVATPNDAHRAPSVAAAKEGKHVFCEKPIATNLNDARVMIEACREAGVKLQIGFHQRFYSQNEIAKNLVDLGAIGEVKAFSTTFREGYDLYPREDAGRDQYYEKSGGAAIVDLGIHRIDIARFFVGDLTEICATVKHSAIPAKIDDNVWIMANFANDATGVISADRFTPTVANQTELYGTEGTIYVSTETINPFQSVPLAVYTVRPLDELPPIVRKSVYPTYWWETPEEETWISIKPLREDPYTKELRAFCKAVVEDLPVTVTGEDGLKALEVVHAAYKSATESKWVRLPIQEDAVSPPDYV